MQTSCTIFAFNMICKCNIFQVNYNNLVVKDSSGNVIDAQYVLMDGVTINLRKFYTEAYLGHSSNQVSKYWFLFQVSLPPLGWNTYFISNAAGTGKEKGIK